MIYKNLSDEEKREYHRIKHSEYRNRNRERYREIVKKSAFKRKNKVFSEEEYQKQQAKRTLNNKIIHQKIKRKNCVFCNNTKTEGHHYDYSKPLEVKWMCKHCHEIFHQILKITI